MATRTPTQIEDLNDVVEITAGDTFSLALLKDGRVFGWGSPYEGRLLDTLEPYFKPTELSSLTQFLNKKHAHIKKIKSSGSYTVILTDNGKLYSWGRSYFGANGARPNALINETEIYQDVTPVIDEAYKGQKVVDFKLSPFALIFTTGTMQIYVRQGQRLLHRVGAGLQTDRVPEAAAGHQGHVRHFELSGSD